MHLAHQDLTALVLAVPNKSSLGAGVQNEETALGMLLHVREQIRNAR